MVNIFHFIKKFISINNKTNTAINSTVNNQQDALKPRTLNHANKHEMQMKLGDTVQITCKQHNSVGIWDDIQYDESFFELNTQSRYKYPDKQNMPGGDEQEINFYLTAKTCGFSTVRVIRNFRGDVTTKEIIEICVR